MMYDMDMESDLQHLIRISIDKMVNVESAHTNRRGNRKGGEIDLRKTLLVAHLIQEVRTAYLEDNCQIFENSLSDIHNDCCREEELDESQILEYNKSWKRQQFTHESNFFIDDEGVASISHPSNVQSCLTNSKSMVSRICQVTRPLCVSVNTNHVMTYSTEEEKTGSQDDDTSSQEEDSFICEELDVSSCCEVESTPFIEDRSSTSVSSSSILPPLSVETTVKQQVPVIQQDHQTNCNTHTSSSSSSDAGRHSSSPECHSKTQAVSIEKPSSNVCVLPKKKRPLPKEFLEELAAQQPCPKQSKTVTTYQNSGAVVSTPSTSSVTSQSWSTSTTVSTVSSSIGSSYNSHESNPKVVVQLTQSLDYSFPLTCTQILLRHHSVYDNLSRRALA